MRPNLTRTLGIASSVLLLSLLGLSLGTSSPAAAASELRVALDIGHSPASPGAISARGVPEYDFNRKIALLLLTRLKQDPQFQGAFLVNETGERLSLAGRRAVAESRRADLLLSLHHDSVYPDQLSQWVYQGRVLDVCDDYGGYSIFYSEKNGSPAESARLADCLGAQLRRAGFSPNLNHAGRGNRILRDRHKGLYTFDNLVVLKSAVIPAVLVECGVIKNSREEIKLCDPRQQHRIVEALYQGLRQYAGARR